MLTYKIIDHTADTGIEVIGDDLKDLFVTTAQAFTDMICDFYTVEPIIQKSLHVKAHDQDELLRNFLNELLYLFDTKQYLFSKIEIQNLTETELKATISGEEMHPEKHDIKMGIKAITYHQLHIEQTESGYLARVIFDV